MPKLLCKSATFCQTMIYEADEETGGKDRII